MIDSLSVFECVRGCVKCTVTVHDAAERESLHSPPPDLSTLIDLFLQYFFLVLRLFHLCHSREARIRYVSGFDSRHHLLSET